MVRTNQMALEASRTCVIRDVVTTWQREETGGLSKLRAL